MRECGEEIDYAKRQEVENVAFYIFFGEKG
jgi:hypothetical protein